MYTSYIYRRETALVKSDEFGHLKHARCANAMFKLCIRVRNVVKMTINGLQMQVRSHKYAERICGRSSKAVSVKVWTQRSMSDGLLKYIGL